MCRDALRPARRFRIADIVFQINTDRPPDQVHWEGPYETFQDDGTPDVEICARYDGLPDLDIDALEPTFDSQMIWSLHRAGDKQVFVLRSPAENDAIYRIAVADDDLRRVDVFTRLRACEREIGVPLSGPLEFPLAEALMIGLLSRARGVLVHACGIDNGGQGLLFAGNSTHGKSTMAGLWRGRGRILNDDRIVIRWRDGRPWMFGTPWHGDLTTVSPTGVPLDRVFFLAHGQSNKLVPTSGVRAARSLFTRTFPPFWDAAGMDFTLQCCERIAEAVPCSELVFAPDKRIVDFVQCNR